MSIIVGNDGNNVLTGTAGKDLVFGLSGNDQINAGAGDDIVRAGNGNDTVEGGQGNDLLEGENGNDTLNGGAGIDIVLGGAGNDTLDGGAGSDLVDGGRGNDTLVYRASENSNTIDIYSGGSGRDTLRIFVTAAQAASSAFKSDMARLKRLIDRDGEATTVLTSINLLVVSIENLEVIVVGGGNHAPTAVDDRASTSEDAAVTIAAATLLANDTDPDAGDTKTLVSVGNAQNGSVSINGDGNVVFVPAANFFGNGSFTYTIRDAAGATSTATVVVAVQSVNDAPVVSATVAGSAAEDSGSRTVNLLQNASDVDQGAVLHVENLVWSENPGGLPAGFALSGNSLVVDTSDPAYGSLGAGSSFTAHFSFGVVDEHGARVAQSATITIRGSNDAPLVVGPAVATEDEDVPYVPLTLAAHDVDAGDAVESFTLTSLPPGAAGLLYTDASLSNAAVVGVAYAASGGILTLYFAPRANFNGEVHFNFEASDGDLSSAAATATITLRQENDLAAFGGDTSGNGNEDGGPIVGTLTSLDDADGMTTPNFRIELGDGASNGFALIDSVSGHWSYTPNAGFTGADHFTVSVTDDDGNVETWVIGIAVSPVTDPTVAHDDEFTGTEDAGATGNVLANDFNPGNETVVALSGVRDAASLPRIVVTEIMANPALVSDADGEWFEVYNAGAAPVDLNGWTVEIGGNSILVDSPTPLLVAPGGFFVFAANSRFVNSASGAYVTGPLGLANDGATITLFDPDGHEIDSVDYRPANVPADPPNTFPADVEGHSFYLRDPGADNNDGLLWETTPSTSQPYDNMNLGTPGRANPVFGGVVGMGDPPVVGQPAVFLSGALLTLNADGTFVFDSNHAYDFLAEGQSFIEQFSYTLSDGQTANVVLTIEGANDAPVAHDDAYAALEDVPLIAALPNAPSVFGNDSDVDSGAVLTASLVDSTSHGSLVFNADGTFTYTPDPDFSGTDSFTYLASDGFVSSNVARVEIQVIALNDAPVASDDEATTDAQTTISGNVLGNDTDIDGDALSVLAVAALSPDHAVPHIVISEIMDNPAGASDLTGEWFEVFNAGAVPVDLNGWTIQIGSNTVLVDNNAPLLVPSGGYFVFAASDDFLQNGGLPPSSNQYETGPLGLVDSGIAIALFDAEGNEIDRVDTSAIVLPPEGHSFFLLDASSDNSLGGSWETSSFGTRYGNGANFGTPGQGALVSSDPIAEIGEPVMLASGALLTLNADGTFDYDPNGAFDSLAAGDTAEDGFAYMTSDGHGGIDTAVVTIIIQTSADPMISASSFLL